jgi:hypothetical protein
MAVDAVLTRFATARDAVVLQSNRFLLTSLFLSLLYAIKIIGLRVDLVLFDYKVFDTPYGISIFCFAANLCFCIALSRYLDARAFDRMLRAICDNEWPQNAYFSYETYPQTNAWLGPTSSFVGVLHKAGVRTRLANLIVTLAALVLSVVYLIPLVCGIHFLYSFDSLSDPQAKGIQYWGVAAISLTSLLFLMASLSLTAKDVDEGD